ncbi:hypothetical protein GCM10009623_35030 [Nocardioides aestuarii]
MVAPGVSRDRTRPTGQPVPHPATWTNGPSSLGNLDGPPCVTLPPDVTADLRTPVPDADNRTQHRTGGLDITPRVESREGVSATRDASAQETVAQVATTVTW